MPEVNWSEVKTGTLINVRGSVLQDWLERPFLAVHTSGGFLTYKDSSCDYFNIEHWDYAKLITQVE